MSGRGFPWPSFADRIGKMQKEMVTNWGIFSVSIARSMDKCFVIMAVRKKC